MTKSYYTLSWDYKFELDESDTVYFAYGQPYTYTYLCTYLRQLSDDPKISMVMRRRDLCKTLSGNVCEVVTVTGPCNTPEELERRPAVIITARVHPGESVRIVFGVPCCSLYPSLIPLMLSRLNTEC